MQNTTEVKYWVFPWVVFILGIFRRRGGGFFSPKKNTLPNIGDAAERFHCTVKRLSISEKPPQSQGVQNSQCLRA